MEGNKELKEMCINEGRLKDKGEGLKGRNKKRKRIEEEEERKRIKMRIEVEEIKGGRLKMSKRRWRIKGRKIKEED